MCNRIKLLTANDLLHFVNGLGIGVNRTTLTRYQSAGILTLPHQFLHDDELYNDIPDIRTKYYHPISVVEFIVNTLLYKGDWLKLNSDFRIARPVQLDIFTGRIAFLSDADMVQKFENRFIDCGIGSFKKFSFTVESNEFFQESMIRKAINVLVVDRELNKRYGESIEKLNNSFDPLWEEQRKILLASIENTELPSYTTIIIENCDLGCLEQLKTSLSYAVFHSITKDTPAYINYQKMLYSRTFEQVVNDYLPAILSDIDLKEFNVPFFTGIKE